MVVEAREMSRGWIFYDNGNCDQESIVLECSSETMKCLGTDGSISFGSALRSKPQTVTPNPSIMPWSRTSGN